jgi:hypothetical protein
MDVLRILKTAIGCALAGVLLAARVDPAAAMPASSHLATEAGGVIAVGWRGHAYGVSHGDRERALIAREIVGGAVPNPGPLYGRYLGYYGYPGRYPCCYYPQSFDRVYYPYYYAYRTVQANPTWWDYPVHWEGW